MANTTFDGDNNRGRARVLSDEVGVDGNRKAFTNGPNGEVSMLDTNNGMPRLHTRKPPPEAERMWIETDFMKREYGTPALTSVKTLDILDQLVDMKFVMLSFPIIEVDVRDTLPVEEGGFGHFILGLADDMESNDE